MNTNNYSLLTINYKRGVTMMSEQESIQKRLVELLRSRGLHIAAAESITAGMISSLIAEVPGASEVLELGICSYSNRIKHEVLGVSQDTLDKYTEYSIETAMEMADCVRRRAGADIAVSTTGIAGPGGGDAARPVGTVFIGISTGEMTRAYEYHFSGSRNEIRRSAAGKALEVAFSSLLTAAD